MCPQMPLEFHSPGFDRRALFASPQPFMPRVRQASASIHNPPIIDSDEHGDTWMYDYEMDLDGNELELENSPPASPSTATSASDESDTSKSIPHETEYHPIIDGLFPYFIASRKFNLISFM